MATSFRVSQAPILALRTTVPKFRISQAPILALRQRADNSVRVSQAPLLVLRPNAPIVTTRPRPQVVLIGL